MFSVGLHLAMADAKLYVDSVEWWAKHKDFRGALMLHIAVCVSEGLSDLEIKQSVLTLLESEKDMLPCVPGEFLESYFETFWPKF